MRKLNFYPTEPIDELAWPEESKQITEDSPALEVFTDFTQSKPLVIDAQTTAVEAEQLMLKAHVRLKLVVDSDNHFLGVISLDDINQQEQVKQIANGAQRMELALTDFMHPRESIKAFDFHELSQACISQVIDALQESGERHCLVVDHQTHKIRGIISASDIARKLHLPINIASKSSFVDIFSAVKEARAR